MRNHCTAISCLLLSASLVSASNNSIPSPAKDSVNGTEVEIIGSSDPFQLLFKWREENVSRFIDRDTVLYYHFTYRATSIADSSNIETASGDFAIRYNDQYKYPIHLPPLYGNPKLLTYTHTGDINAPMVKSMKYTEIPSTMFIMNFMEERLHSYYKHEFKHKLVSLKKDSLGNRIFDIREKVDSNLLATIKFDSTKHVQCVSWYRPNRTSHVPIAKDCDTPCYKNYIHYAPNAPAYIDYSKEEVFQSTKENVPIKINIEFYTIAPVESQIKQTKEGESYMDNCLCTYQFNILQEQLETLIKKEKIIVDSSK